jgi:putative two-component system response regulator
MSPVNEDPSVLLIDDDPALVEAYRRGLIPEYRVTVVKSRDAFDYAKQMVPDIIFLNIRGPKLEGIAVLERLRSDDVTRKIPVVIDSSCSVNELLSGGFKLGPLDYLNRTEAGANLMPDLTV